MSHSRKKTPISGITTARSEAFDKQTWHRAYRRAERVRVSADPESEPRHINEFTSAWVRQKDGKIYYKKDSPYLSKMMRK